MSNKIKVFGGKQGIRDWRIEAEIKWINYGFKKQKFEGGCFVIRERTIKERIIKIIIIVLELIVIT